MDQILVIVFLWAIFASLVGLALAAMEAKINDAKPRWLNSVLINVCTPFPVGILWVGIRLNLTRLSNQRKAERVLQQAAEATLRQHGV
jgi:hypothetical protein